VEAAATLLEHGEAQALFAPMVDHELPPKQEEALRSHLQACPDCQQGFEKYTRAVALVRSVGREKVPDDFTAQVLRRVRKRRRAFFGPQGGRFFEHINIPIEGSIAIIIAACLAALIFFLSR
jgi:anti-sigma factor RsiW